MTPVSFKGVNCTLGPPPGDQETVVPLPVFRNGTCCVSCWELSGDELAEIVRTRRVFLSVFVGDTQPPVFVGSETTARDVVADYGAWAK